MRIWQRTDFICEGRKLTVAPKAKYYYLQTTNSRSRTGVKYYKDIFQDCKILSERLYRNLQNGKIGKEIDVESIIEFKYVTHIGYGVIMGAILCKAGKSDVLQYSEYLQKYYPNGMKNKYLKYYPIAKRLFIHCSYMKQYWLLKLMVKIGKK